MLLQYNKIYYKKESEFFYHSNGLLSIANYKYNVHSFQCANCTKQSNIKLAKLPSSLEQDAPNVITGNNKHGQCHVLFWLVKNKRDV